MKYSEEKKLSLTCPKCLQLACLGNLVCGNCCSFYPCLATFPTYRERDEHEKQQHDKDKLLYFL